MLTSSAQWNEGLVAVIPAAPKAMKNVGDGCRDGLAKPWSLHTGSAGQT